MKLSYRAFLRFVDFQGTATELANVLSSLGFPNDGIKHEGAGVGAVVVGKILEKKRHPQADRLSLLKVDVGSQQLPIVCGASNMKEGDHVALAPVGAKIPGKDGQGMVMKEAKIRGETSMGMCCSAAELGLGEEADGILTFQTKDFGEHSEYLGQPLGKYFDLEDWIIEVDITPNRGDAMSYRGLAREVAAKLGLRLKAQPSVKWKNPLGGVNPSIESLDDAKAFVACLIQGVKVGESPSVWRTFLTRCGARPISNLVDVTNIVLFETGHPIHFFDADKVDAATIAVRRAKAGESLTLLNDQTIELHPEDLVIADQSGPLSLAGVMGGKASMISSETKNVLMEVASFDPKRIRASARRHQLSSESSARFEKGVMPFRIEEVVERALGLVKELSGFETAGGTKAFDRDWKPSQVLWDRSRVESKLGKLEASDNDLFELLRRLDYQLEAKGSAATLTFPGYRADLAHLEDVMEDLARLIGYENLEKQALRSTESISSILDLREHLSTKNKIVERFCALGFSETIHLSFGNRALATSLGYADSNWVELVNPIHAERSVLRKNILPDLLDRARANGAHGEDHIMLVEAGPVFRRDASAIYENSPVSERQALAVVWMPKPIDKKHLWENKNTDDFFRFKGMCESVWGGFKNPRLRGEELEENFTLLHPRRHFQTAGFSAGELHPQWVRELGISGRCFIGEWLLSSKLAEMPMSYSRPPTFPSIDLDASFLVDEKILVQEILSEAEKAAGVSNLEWMRPYDIFESKELSKGKRSLTFAMRYRSSERTLTLEEAKKSHEALVKQLLTSFGSDRIALR